MNLPDDHNAPVYALELLDKLTETFGEPERANLEMIIPAIRRKTSVEVPSGSWRVVAHPNQIESAQVVEGHVETPV